MQDEKLGQSVSETKRLRLFLIRSVSLDVFNAIGVVAGRPRQASLDVKDHRVSGLRG